MAANVRFAPRSGRSVTCDFSLAGLANNGLLSCNHIIRNIGVETLLRV
jgi:hypothetical protein